MADPESGLEKHAVATPSQRDADLSSEDELPVIAKGQVDPVYEAKARVLNKAVRLEKSPLVWHGGQHS
jgi:hypothetical protein